MRALIVEFGAVVLTLAMLPADLLAQDKPKRPVPTFDAALQGESNKTISAVTGQDVDQRWLVTPAFYSAESTNRMLSALQKELAWTVKDAVFAESVKADQQDMLTKLREEVRTLTNEMNSLRQFLCTDPKKVDGPCAPKK